MSIVAKENYAPNANDAIVKYAEVNGKGELTSEIMETSAKLSDCQPIVTNDGIIVFSIF